MRNEQKVSVVLTTAAIVLAAILIPTYAGTPSGAQNTTWEDLGSWTPASPGSVNVISNHVYKSNMEATMATYHWAGIYGNASGTIQLGDDENNSMVAWTADGRYLYFNNDNSVNWSALGAAISDDVSDEYIFLLNGSDCADNAFNETVEWSSSILPAINTTAAPTIGTSPWYTLALKEASSDVIFVGEIETPARPSFDGTPSNYQILLPENGDGGDANPTGYYVWMELE